MNLINIIGYISLALGVTGGIIVLIGCAIGLYGYIASYIKNKKISQGQKLDQVRVQLVRHITFGLEFFIAKDVIETIFVPSWEELAQLAGLVAIRIALSFFLARELRGVEKKYSV